MADSPRPAAGPHPAPGPEPPLLELNGISRYYPTGSERIEILDAVDLRLLPGETVAIVGASGIGKSTLLHLIGALDRPNDGALLFNGDDLFRFDDRRLAAFRNRSIGFVFQFHHLLAEFTALENVMMPVLISGERRSTARALAAEILARVGLSHRRHHRVTQLSGGEQQRVALARALVLKPRVLLADEPTGNLDEENSEQIHRLLLELNREFGMALVVVTHNPTLAALMGRRITITDKQLVELT